MKLIEWDVISRGIHTTINNRLSLSLTRKAARQGWKCLFYIPLDFLPRTPPSSHTQPYTRQRWHNMRRLINIFHIFLLSTVLPDTKTLHITSINVPSIVDVRDVANLSCSYNIGTQKLNSVKWYKNEKEFYRWVRCAWLRLCCVCTANTEYRGQIIIILLLLLRLRCDTKNRAFADTRWIFHIVFSVNPHIIVIPHNHYIMLPPFFYKNSRYAPFLPQKNLIFPVDGIHVTKEFNCDHERCSVNLDNLSMESTGSYRCEVSGDAPEFRIVHDTSNMTVIGECFPYTFHSPSQRLHKRWARTFLFSKLCDAFHCRRHTAIHSRHERFCLAWKFQKVKWDIR